MPVVPVVQAGQIVYSTMRTCGTPNFPLSSVCGKRKQVVPHLDIGFKL